MRISRKYSALIILFLAIIGGIVGISSVGTSLPEKPDNTAGETERKKRRIEYAISYITYIISTFPKDQDYLTEEQFLRLRGAIISSIPKDKEQITRRDVSETNDLFHPKNADEWKALRCTKASNIWDDPKKSIGWVCAIAYFSRPPLIIPTQMESGRLMPVIQPTHGDLSIGLFRIWPERNGRTGAVKEWTYSDIRPESFYDVDIIFALAYREPLH